MRTIGVLLALGFVVLAQEKRDEASQHDTFGFPISFNGETVTRADILRELGVTDEAAIGSMRAARDRVLRQKLETRIGELLGFEVTDERLKHYLDRQIEQVGSEYEYYNKLEQEGETRAGHEASLRKRITRWFIQGRLDPDLPTALLSPLPYDLDARPREVRIAFEHDGRKRFEDYVRARYLVVEIDLTPAERKRIIVRNIDDPDASGEEIERRIRAKLDAATAKLNAGVPFEALVREMGGDVEKQKAHWADLPPDADGDPNLEFLLSAEGGRTSEPIPTSSGGFRLLHLLEIEKRLKRDISDPEVYEYYRGEIRALRRAKAQARLLLRALDNSTVRPRRVRDDLRKAILADLELANQGLAALGLH